MPPDEEAAADARRRREFVLNWIDETLTKVDCGGPRDPGRVTIRRLNRAEYNNTIRDLFGVDFKPAEDFPSDDVGYGFDNIGDVLSFRRCCSKSTWPRPRRSSTAAIEDRGRARRATASGFQPQQHPEPVRAAPSRASRSRSSSSPKARPSWRSSTSRPTAITSSASAAGARTSATSRPKVVVRVDGKDVQELHGRGRTQRQAARPTRSRPRFKAGEQRVAVAFTNALRGQGRKKRSASSGSSASRSTGRSTPRLRRSPPRSSCSSIARPKAACGRATQPRRCSTEFARRAYRRPVKPDEVARLLKLFDIAAKQGEPFEAAIRLPMKAVLVSPHFLFRVEDDPEEPERHPHTRRLRARLAAVVLPLEHMPDDELFRLAAKGDAPQARRARSAGPADAQGPEGPAPWPRTSPASGCELRNLAALAPDKGYFPDLDEELRAAMIRETELFFEYDRPERPQHPRLPRRRLHLPQRPAGAALRHRRTSTASSSAR